MDAARTADKYVSRAGGPPVPTTRDVAEDIVTLSNFILWHEDDDMFGGVKTKDAFMAMCRLLNIEPHKIRSIIRD